MEEKNSPAELVIRKTKSCSPKKITIKNWEKKERMEHSNHGLQDQAAAPYHCSTSIFEKKFGIILYILIYVVLSFIY